MTLIRAAAALAVSMALYGCGASSEPEASGSTASSPQSVAVDASTAPDAESGSLANAITPGTALTVLPDDDVQPVTVTAAQILAAAQQDADTTLVRNTCFALFGYGTTLKELFGVFEGAEFQPLTNDFRPNDAIGFRCFYGSGRSNHSVAVAVLADPSKSHDSPLGPATGTDKLESGTWTGPLAAMDLTVGAKMITPEFADAWMSRAMSRITLG